MQVATGAVLKVAPRAGEFFLAEKQRLPTILLSGGVGPTPMVCMVEAIAARQSSLEAHYAHGGLNWAVHAMDAHVRAMARRHGRISVATIYPQSDVDDVLAQVARHRRHNHYAMAGSQYAAVGSWISSFVGRGPSCGSSWAAWACRRAGVPAAGAHCEFFGRLMNCWRRKRISRVGEREDRWNLAHGRHV